LSFNINQFKANGLQFNGSRPSLFKVLLSAPAGVGVNILPRSEFLVKAASLPAMSIDYIDVPYMGRKIKVAGDRTYQDWNVTVMNDEDFGLRAMFETWNNMMNVVVSNVLDESVAPSGYKVDMQVLQMTKTGDVARSYNFVGAFPYMIDAMPLGWEMTNQIGEFGVTFAYDWWEPLDQQSAAQTKLYDTYEVQLPGDGTALRDNLS
jgi:hypothetical protein